MRRLPALIAAALLTLGLAPAAGAATNCTFDPLTGAVTVTTDTAVTIAPVDDEIRVGGGQCDTATVTNTDTIEVEVTGMAIPELTVDLSAQPLGPGLTDEGASSEIEMTIDGASFDLAIVGSGGSDAISLFKTGLYDTTGLVNLNDAEATRDGDISFYEHDAIDIEIELGAGDDIYGAAATDGSAGVPFTVRPVSVIGGDGSDHMYGIPTHAFDGGGLTVTDPFNDTIDFSWLNDTCYVLFDAKVGETTSIACDGGGDLTAHFFETVIGGDGSDWVFAAGWERSLRGGVGDDHLFPAAGDEAIQGGSGWDQVVVDTTSDLRFDLADRTISGDGHDTFSGVEGFFSTGGGDDRFVGGPAASVDFLSGGTGRDVVNLSSAMRGYDLATQAGLDPSNAMGSPRLWISDAAVIGSPFADRFVGGAVRDDFTGGGGNDRISGGDLADHLMGGHGSDHIAGGPGVDTCSGGPGDDVFRSCER